VTDVNPYTTATALSAGWAWKTPLFGRDGCGYVYSSSHSDAERAESELRAFLGPASEKCPARHIRMNVGRRRNAWVSNCVGIGLSAAFVEPLESTGIFMIQHGIEELVRHFPGSASMDGANIMSYNKLVAECVDGVREFLAIHFCATDRIDTPYWRDMKSLDLPGPLAERMKIFSARLPGARSIYQPYHGFEAYSWSVILLGMNYMPPRHLEVLDSLDDSEAMEMFTVNQRRAAHLAATLPSHVQYLVRQREMAGMPRSQPEAM
jgi:tryptophan halogenase